MGRMRRLNYHFPVVRTSICAVFQQHRLNRVHNDTWPLRQPGYFPAIAENGKSSTIPIVFLWYMSRLALAGRLLNHPGGNAMGVSFVTLKLDGATWAAP